MVTTHKGIKSTIMYIILVIVGVVMLFPVFWMLLACFKTNNEIFGSLKLLPSSWSFEAFAKGWETTGTFTYARYFSNTFLLVIPTVLFTIVSCSLVAYGFARFDFKGKNVLFMILIATLMLPNSVIIIPRYALFNKLHWLDSYMTFWMPALFACYPFFVFMMVQFLRGIPRDLDESAYMDGCSSMRCFVQILLPLLKPALFSASLFQFLWTWNDFLMPSILISDSALRTITVNMYIFKGSTQSNWNLFMAALVISIIPIVIVYLFTQRYITSGITAGAVKQ